MSTSKIEAASRVTDAAIRCLFRAEDPLAVRLLASSAYQVLRNLADQNGKVDAREVEKQYIAKVGEKLYYGRLQEAANFLKHADRDPQAVLADFDEGLNDLDLLSCTSILLALGVALSSERLAFLQWCAVIYPGLLSEDAPFKRTEIARVNSGLQSSSRADQLRLGKELVSAAYQVRRGAV